MNSETSDRDGEPFKIRWDQKGVADHAIVFESVGVEDKRYVALGVPRELDAEEYDGYWTGAIKPATPSGYHWRRLKIRRSVLPRFLPTTDLVVGN